MRILTVCQNKGGEGKTTWARLIAEWAARLGLRVLMIDLDQQCNMSRRYLKMETDEAEAEGVLPPVHPDFEEGDMSWDGRSSVVDIFNGKEVMPYPTANEYIEVIPGYARDMIRLQHVRADEVREKIHDRMHTFLNLPDVQQRYDLAICDTSPTKGPLMISAVRAATHLLIPAQMEQQSIEGLHGMIQLWRQENRDRKPDDQINLIGILPNKFREVALQIGLLDGLRSKPSMKPYVIPIIIHQRTVFAETDHPEAKPKSVFDLRKNDKAREEATQACMYIMQKLGLAEPAALAGVA